MSFLRLTSSPVTSFLGGSQVITAVAYDVTSRISRGKSRYPRGSAELYDILFRKEMPRIITIMPVI